MGNPESNMKAGSTCPWIIYERQCRPFLPAMSRAREYPKEGRYGFLKLSQAEITLDFEVVPFLTNLQVPFWEVNR